MNIGQTVDAISTPFVGVIVDKFGKKKNWMLLGMFGIYIIIIQIFCKL